MTEQNSISSAVFGLQDTLKKLRQQWICLQDQSTSEKQPSELFALGPVNLDKARQEFSQHINTIRNVCSQFETEVLGDVMKMGVGADPAFRKHFTHLKEQATLESTVMRVKDTLSSTKEFLDKNLREKEESKSKIETQRLEKLAQSMGLVTFVDSTQKFESNVPITTITLGGTVIVVDIDIDDKGRVLRTKLTYVSDTLQNDQDDRVDLMLTENLQTRQFELFKRNLGSLASLDQLNVKYSPVDFFSIIKNLLSDLRTIYDEEISVEPELTNVLTQGHGIPNLHLNYPGISIAYWMDKEHMDSINWQEVKTTFETGISHSALANTSRLLISFEDSIQPLTYIPESRPSCLLGNEAEDSIDSEHFKVVTETAAPAFMPHFKFVRPLPTHPESLSIPIRFVALLDPPMPVSDKVCQKLMNVTGLVSLDETTEVPCNSSSMSLEELLVINVAKAVSCSDKWISSFDDTPEQLYTWMKSPPTSAKMVSRIPFQHSVQIYNIIQCLRQQQLFNTLFKSIFNINTYRPQQTKEALSFSLEDILAESEKDKTLKVEITTIDAPNAIFITLPAPPLPNQLFIMVSISIDIPLETPTKPIVRLHAPSNAKSQRWNPSIFDEAAMTEQIQTLYSIPELIRQLYKCMSNADTYLIDRSIGKRRFSEDDFSSSIDDSNKIMKMELD
ncbi:mediator of RNA polymerase II transcription subunit 1-domain-containing protein, partial [Parasitella parasitica]